MITVQPRQGVTGPSYSFGSAVQKSRYGTSWQTVLPFHKDSSWMMFMIEILYDSHLSHTLWEDGSTTTVPVIAFRYVLIILCREDCVNSVSKSAL